MDRLCLIEQTQRDIKNRVEKVEKEVHPNAGSTMRDSLDRIEQKLPDNET